MAEIQKTAAEEVMKAVLALVIIYVGTFLIAIRGSSQNSVQAAPQNRAAQDQTGAPHPKAVDPAKDADIRSLMELLGVRDMVQESAAKGIEQYRESLLATVPDNERGQAFVKSFVDAYQKKLTPEDVTDDLVAIYDQHFTEDDIKSLLQFYGSPVGQKYAAEMPKVFSESSAAARSVSLRVARDVMQDLRKQYPGVGAQARLQKPRAGGPAEQKQQAQAQSQDTPKP